MSSSARGLSIILGINWNWSSLKYNKNYLHNILGVLSASGHPGAVPFFCPTNFLQWLTTNSLEQLFEFYFWDNS